MKINAETVYLYGSDLWNNAAKNEALANYYWAPLTFAADGSINPLNCLEDYRLPRKGKISAPADLDNSSGSDGFSLQCDIAGPLQRVQSFTVSRTGVLSKLSVTLFKNNDPDQGLTIAIYRADGVAAPTGNALFTKTLTGSAVGWSAKSIAIAPDLTVKKGGRYVVVLKSAATSGCYGIAVSDPGNFPGGAAAISRDDGATFTVVDNHELKFQTFITTAKR
ncbi:MAG TPA: hypothetical protein VNS58_32215 [Puia sp.]|nr:hypothetical protein [Puia sp.]